MRPPECIETQRLRLRPVVESDAPAIFDYAGGARTTLFMNFARHRVLAESVAFARRCEACWSSGSAFPWAITSGSHKDLLGVIELRLAPPKADFGYILREAFWGDGLASEAATAVADWALSQPEIHRVWATCHPDNLASARVLTKAGLQFEARLENWEARPQLGEAAGPSLCFARTPITGARA
jgi:RimJ/RimL family protein N-acetyltransferase